MNRLRSPCRGLLHVVETWCFHSYKIIYSRAPADSLESIRRECLDHVIILNETGLRRILLRILRANEDSLVAEQGRAGHSTNSNSRDGTDRASPSSRGPASSLRTNRRLIRQALSFHSPILVGHPAISSKASTVLDRAHLHP